LLSLHLYPRTVKYDELAICDMLNRIIVCIVCLGFLSTGIAQIKTIGDRYVGCAPDTFTFYTVGNTHSGQIWNSGNGNNSVLDTAIFLYGTPGTYKVKIGNLEKDIVILAKLNLNFTTDSVRKGCFPYKFNLRDITAYPPGIVPTKVNWVYQSGGTKQGTSITDSISNYYLYYCFVNMIVNTNVPSCNGDVRKDSFFEILDIPRAQIDISPDSACHVPFTPTIQNTSRDSLKTALTYLWKWDHPAAGSSTNIVPPPLTYTTNGVVKFTLEAVNKFGCKGYDTFIYKIDTPTLDFNVNSKICAKEEWDLGIKNMDTKNYTYTFISDKRANGQDIFTLVKPPHIEYPFLNTNSYKFKGYDGDFPNNNVIRKITIVKTLKGNPSCKVSLTKSVLICQTFPKFKILQSKVCGLPFRDTIVVTNTPDPYNCWDSIGFQVAYWDKYKVKITVDTFNAYNFDEKVQSIKDSILIYGLNKWDKVDSFYRKERLELQVGVTFFSKSDSFSCGHTSGGSFLKTESMNSHLVNYFNKGCDSTIDSFRVYYKGLGTVTSIKWHFGDDTIYTTGPLKADTTHRYRTGKFRAYAVVTNSLGCVDTTNPVFVQRGDSIIPELHISKTNFCIGDSTIFAIKNKDSFDRWRFLSDENKVLDCPNADSVQWKNFYKAGKQYVYIIAEKNGCITKVKDSIYVDGPKFNLDYDFKCSRKDSIKFFLRDTVGIRGAVYHWDFADGMTSHVLMDTIWHKYTASNQDYWVKVSMQNPGGCFYQDSVQVKIRKVKAIFTDTLFCKQTNPGMTLNGTPYLLDPNQSQNADYICDYKYTWLMSSVPKIGQTTQHFQPVTYSGIIGVHFPLDTLRLSLIARDINGCSDTMQKMVTVSDNHIDFKMIYDSCPKVQTVQCINLSSSPFGIRETRWDVRKVVNGVDTFVTDSSKLNSPSFILNIAIADTFKIRLKLYDSANCSIKEMTKLFVFVVDTSKLIVPDSVCNFSVCNIFSNENDIVNYQYRWKVDNMLTPDTTYRLNYRFQTVGKHRIRLEKTHRWKGCTEVFLDSTEVGPHPRLRMDNSFDNATNKCFPAVTTIQYFDSANIPSLRHKFVHKNSPRTQNPTTIVLDTGVNLIYGIFTTSYGCYDSIVNYDTVYRPRADIVMDKRMICKYDSIRFTLINRRDVDSILWSFGDGYISTGKDTSVVHPYSITGLNSDTIPISYILYAPNKTCPTSNQDSIVVLASKSGHYLNNKLDTAYCLAPVKIVNQAAKYDYLKWSFGNGVSANNTEDSFMINYAQAGQYRIVQYSYRNPLGCVDSSSSNIILYPYPKFHVQHDTICLGQPLEISYTVNLPNTKMYLRPDSLKGSPFSSSPIRTQISQNTILTITGISEYGCTDSVKTQANVILPKREKSWDTTVALGSKVILPVGYDPYWTYTWRPKWINPSCENCANPELQIFDSVIYELTMQDYRTCFKNSFTYRIHLYPDILVRIPTAFTPNGDGNNDILYPKGFGIKKLLSFRIFNRQGQLLFLSNDEGEGWDGNYNGMPQNSDVYYYVYEAESFIPGKKVSGEGNFMLLR